MNVALPPLERRWSFPAAPDPHKVQELQRELGLPAALCRLLLQRGHTDGAGAREFLRPHPGQLHPPRMAGMGDAVQRLRRAIRDAERILVHGDYDVDGICAAALYARALRMMGADAEAFVPNRLVDGYDLSEAGIRAAARAGATLILTADCGIVAHEAVEQARRSGIDVIVTDHHTPGASLPPAAAVVNPNRADCPYPEKGLAGVGVAYKVCCALAEELGFPPERLACFLDLVALATVADLAPLRGENRALVRWGLRVLADTPNPGLRALLESTGLAQHAQITAGQVGFILAPRINAVGRMGDAQRGLQLLLSDDEAEARRIAGDLEEENRSRREVEGETLRQALALLERSYDPSRDRAVVLAGEGWHPGVIGIVASRVVERIHRPTVMIALNGDDEGRGSARSIPGFDLFRAMQASSAYLTRFGGHRAAAGCSIRPERVPLFRDALNRYACSHLAEDLLVPEVRVDLEVELGEADAKLHSGLRHFAPCGIGNPNPTLAVRAAGLGSEPRVVGRNHLKLMLVSNGHRLEAIGWGMGDRLAELRQLARVDAAFHLDQNVWRGEKRLQAKLVDLRPAAE